MHLLKTSFKKMFTLHMMMILLFTVFSSKHIFAIQGVSAQSAILMDQESGRVLYSKNAHQQRRIASITKIMTAILAVESGKLNERVTISHNAEGTEGSSIYLKAGEQMKLEDLVYGLMLRSGNDAAVAIAEHVGGSVEGFNFLMNQKAAEIGMTNTEFANPHGLDDHENHYSTAYDMALLTKYAMKNEKFRKIFGTKRHRAPNPNSKWDRSWENKNKLLTGLYEHTTGGKTGYTKRAKRTLVSTASKNGMNFIAVTLNAPDDWNDHIAMYEWAFDHYIYKKIVSKGKIEDINHEFYQGQVYIKRDIIYPLTTKESKKIKIEIKMLNPNTEWKDNDEPVIAGKMHIYLGKKHIEKLPIYYKDGIIFNEDSWYSIIKELFLTLVGAKRDG